MSRLHRRTISVGGVMVGAVVLALTVPLWLPVLVVVDLAYGHRRLPRTRLIAFGLCWAWLEAAGVLAAFWLWITGRARRRDLHYRLQRWWATHLMAALGTTCGVHPEVEGADVLSPGPVVLLCRHASLADSLVSAWAIVAVAGMRPRYVLKRELLLDPCLDIVGQRLPNHFLDREAPDSQVELDALGHLVHDLGSDDVAVIFPEGTRSNASKRERALSRIAERDPERAARLAGLTRLLPPRASGTLALLRGAPAADVALAWHTGFDGLDSFGRIISRLAHPLPRVRFVVRRVERTVLPDDHAGLEAWLDDTWLELDAAVDAELEGARG